MFGPGPGISFCFGFGFGSTRFGSFRLGSARLGAVSLSISVSLSVSVLVSVLVSMSVPVSVSDWVRLALGSVRFDSIRPSLVGFGSVWSSVVSRWFSVIAVVH